MPTDALERTTAIHQVLADAPDDTLLTSPQTADWLGFSRQSMAPLRCRGGAHPPHVKLGDLHVRYRLGDLRRWVRTRTFAHTTEAAAALAK